MEAEIDYLKSEIEAWKIREETSKKLYESMLKSLEDPSSQGVLVRLNQAQSVSEVKTLQERYTNECNALKISHSNTLRDLHETIRKLKEQTRELEFQGKNEKLGCQQQILDLQTEIFSLKAEVSALKTLQKASESSEKPQVLRKQAEHIEALTSEITKLKSEHAKEIEEIQLQSTENIKELGFLYETDQAKLRSQLHQLHEDFSEKTQLLENELENKIQSQMNSEIQYLNEKISRLVTERNEAEAKLEIFRIEIQNLRDHIASPIVQKNIREKVMRAKKILEKKNNSKEDIGSLKTLLLHLEDGFARVSENEKIYHRLLLQKEVEVKGLKDLIGDKGKCGGFDQGMSTIASSPIGSIENGLHRKTQSFTLLMEDGGTMRRDLRKERVCEVGENKLIDELALYKVKYALFEENASERLDKIKELVKDLKKTGDHGKIDDILQMVIRPIETPDLQLDDY